MVRPWLVTETARRKATLQDLMRHTSGLTYGNRGTSDLHKKYDALYDNLNLIQLTGSEFLNKLGTLPLHYQPGTMWDYSLGLDVLGLVVESVTKQSLGHYLEERLFRPLGMVDTSFVVPSQKAERLAQPLPVDPLTGNPQTWADRTKAPAMECGGGCAVSTAADYLRFAQMLLNRGTPDDARILGRKTDRIHDRRPVGTGSEHRQPASVPEYQWVRLRAECRGQARLRCSQASWVRRATTTGAAQLDTYFWSIRREDLAVVFMAAAPGELRVRNRQLITSLVLQAIAD